MKLRQAFSKLLRPKGHEKGDVGKETDIQPLSSTAPIRRRLDSVRIVVGLDFGTSCTKVAFSQYGRRQIRPVVFDHDLAAYPEFCLPSVAAYDNKRLLLGIEAAKYLENKQWGDGIRRFKVIVAGRHDEEFLDPETDAAYHEYLRVNNRDGDTVAPEEVTAVFLAYAMRQSRIQIEALPEYSEIELDLEYNVCVPIDHIENNAVRPVFEHILAWAELIEREWRKQGDLSEPLELARMVRAEADYDLSDSGGFLRNDQNARVFLVPEAVAQAEAYLVSMEKKEGIHALIDFGAGTTDISIFDMLYGESFSLEPFWYASRNLPRGMSKVEEIIADFLKNEHSGPEMYATKEVAKYLQEMSPEKSPEDLLFEIKKELRALWKMTHRVWGTAYSHWKKEGHWKNVPVYICGGGANVPGIESVFRRSWIEQLDTSYPICSLPVPDNYDSLGNRAPFDRMTVAYGLARSLAHFDGFVLPADCPDHTPPRPIERDHADCDGSGLNPKRSWLG